MTLALVVGAGEVEVASGSPAREELGAAELAGSEPGGELLRAAAGVVRASGGARDVG